MFFFIKRWCCKFAHMKKALIFIGLLLIVCAALAQTVNIRGSKMILQYGANNYSVELKGDSVLIDASDFIWFADKIGSDTLLFGDGTYMTTAFIPGTNVTDITYSELLSYISGNTLTIGGLYRITDFAQAYNIFDGGTNTIIEEQIGAVEPLIVYALTNSTLERIAYSPNYPNDIIYYEPTGVNVNTDIGYSDGAGTLITNFKGVIEFRHDTKQNVSTWYDFRNIKFRRWAVDAVAYNAGTAYVAKDVCKSGVDGKIYNVLLRYW